MTILAATRLVVISFAYTWYSLKTIVSGQPDQYTLRENMAASGLDISADWAVLGPFQIGTRGV
jgi:hypothetical protein